MCLVCPFASMMLCLQNSQINTVIKCLAGGLCGLYTVGSCHNKLVHKSVFILEQTGSDFNYETHLTLLPNIHPVLSFQPEKFLGHKVNSYGQLLSITFTSETSELLPDRVTLLLQGSGTALSADLSYQPLPDVDPSLTPRRSFSVR